MRDGNSPPKIANVTNAVTTAAAIASITRLRLMVDAGLTPIHRISAGAMTMSPTASPSHHVSHTRDAADHARRPPPRSEKTPSVALTIVLSSAASTVNRRMSPTRSNTRPPRAKRLTK